MLKSSVDRRCKQVVAGIALSLSGLLFSAGARADAKLPEDILAAKQLIVGILCSYPPAGYIGLDGTPAGYEIAFVKRIGESAAKQNVKMSTQCVNDSNRIPFLQSGKVDLMVAALAWTPARAEQIDFSDPVWVSNLQLVVPKDSPIKDYADLEGKKVVTVTGTTYQSWLQKCYPKAELVMAQTASDASTMFSQGRADAFAYIDVYGFNFAKNNPRYKVAANLAAPAVQGIGVKKGNTAMLQWINDVVEGMRKNDDFFTMFTAEVKDPLFSDKYRKLVPGPDNQLKYGSSAFMDCKVGS